MVWVALYSFMKDRLWVYAFLIVLVSMVKLLPVIFLLLLFLSPSKSKTRVFIISAATFLFYLWLNFFLEPGYTKLYIDNFF
ncbi:MAG: DUF2029 domain-containing protein [Bacteroidales bacterium]|nr:DUF2029 domain-containing protein [Bacteroidales bacterium]